MKYFLATLLLLSTVNAFSQQRPKNCNCQTGYGMARGDCRNFCMGEASNYTSDDKPKIDRSISSEDESE